MNTYSLHWRTDTIDLFTLCVLFSHCRSCDNTLDNSFIQSSSYPRAYVRIIYEKQRGKFPWELHGKNKNIQAKEVYYSILNGYRVTKTGNKHAKRNLTDFYFKNIRTLNAVRTQLLDALFLPKEITASTRTEAISEILYTSHIPNASNVICPETMTKV